MDCLFFFKNELYDNAINQKENTIYNYTAMQRFFRGQLTIPGRISEISIF